MKIKSMKTILVIVSILGLLLLGGGYTGYRGYVSVRQHRLIKQSRTFLAKGNQRKALLSLQRALRYKPKDVEACRLMAELTETSRSPSALLWRSRVVELKPHSLDDRLALAQTALMLRDYASATNALEGVDASGKKTASYHNVAGTVASTVNQLADAESHFLEATRLEPENPVPQLNLAVVRLHGTNDPVLAGARTTLKNLCANSTNATLRCQAVRELVVDAMRHKQADAALALSKELVEQTNSVFRDRLLRLDVLRATTNAEFEPALVAFQREATNSSGKIYEMAMWQMAKTSPAETLTWLRTLPMNTQTNQPVALLMTECYTMLKDWRGLQASLDQQNWGELEFIRHAFQTRALRGQELGGAAKAEWEQALKAANGQKGSLVMLLRLAAQWNWLSEAEEILWTVVNRYPDEKWAFQALSQALFAGGRTRPLMMLYGQQVKRSPSDLGAKNNLAMTALLLDAQELKPHQLAREVYEKAPTNSSYASTYAFSLHVQEKNAEALKVIEQLKPQDLEIPSISGYYGMILQATGHREKARKYLDLSSKARLLPEEQKLLDRAKTGA
jgi:tetratricopeptide (TPR) repeat protein